MKFLKLLNNKQNIVLIAENITKLNVFVIYLFNFVIFYSEIILRKNCYELKFHIRPDKLKTDNLLKSMTFNY